MNKYINFFISIFSLSLLRVFFGFFAVLGLNFSKFSVLFLIITFISTNYLKLALEYLIPVIFLLALLLSNYFSTGHFIFYTQMNVFAEVFWLGLIAYLLILKKQQLKYEFVILFILQILLSVTFLEEANGRLLFSDDHPSFLYRFILLSKHFPNIPFYDTSWNAGYSAREFFASGMLNIFFSSLPIFYLFDLSNFENAQIYNYIIICGYIFIIPWAVYAAGRLAKLSNASSLVAAVLALGPSTGQFEWLLKYGTLGFCFSAGILPLAFVLAYRVAFEKITWRDVTLLLLVSYCVLSWSLSFIAFLPLVLVAIFRFKEVFSESRRKYLIVFVVLFLLINVPWILTFINESKVTSFVSNAAMPGSSVQHSFDFKLALKNFRGLSQKVNPLLIFLWIPGLLTLKDLRKRYILMSSIVLLLLVAFVGEQFKPQLELKRLIVPASFLMCLLSGVALEAMLNYFKSIINESFSKKIIGTASIVLLSGFFCLSPLNVAAVYSNKSDEHFKFADDVVKSLIDGIKQNADDNRVFVSGFILQELGSSSYYAQDGGHIAPLTAFTGKAMYASHYYHKYWSIVDPIPAEYRKRGQAGIEEFLDLINASSVITHSREWANYCLSNPKYKQIFQAGRFRFFKRSSEKLGYFLSGKGEVKFAEEGFYVKPETEEIILKYRFLPKLKISKGAEIDPVPAFIEDIGGSKTEQVNYIRLKVNSEKLGTWFKVGYYE